MKLKAQSGKLNATCGDYAPVSVICLLSPVIWFRLPDPDKPEITNYKHHLILKWDK